MAIDLGIKATCVLRWPERFHDAPTGAWRVGGTWQTGQCGFLTIKAFVSLLSWPHPSRFQGRWGGCSGHKVASV